MTEKTYRPIDSWAVNRWRNMQTTPPWLHQEVGRRMAEQLQLIKYEPQVWLDWPALADGSHEQIMQRYPQAKGILADDAAQPLQQLLQQFQNPGSWWKPGRWKKAAITGCAPAELQAGCADLLWSNMALHFCPDPLQQMKQWQQLLQQGGFVMFSCFGPDTLKELQTVYARNGWGRPAVDFVDMHDLGDMMMQAGFTDPVMDMEFIELSWASPEALLRELRTMGINAHPQRYVGLRTPRWLNQLHQAFALLSSQDPDGKTIYSLTFEIIYGHAFKLGSGIRAEEETAVGLEDMRAMLRQRR
ncbi:hypothetical protein CUZ56_02704 [Saezia sanguinis]|uniref:Methyltransferase type 11 domain-containing protein n=1 Tax=Saezia sanguinis TaxID=1965230 RepID=A0A433SA52_9BURK|nr:methyltransferase domain-containing protein [Saezia sanguinis]RUS65618.1 hypothetical protein CUZ56_02704 [Saezia sanguinis]